MTVQELIELLREHDPDAEVVQTGAHGNPSPFSDIRVGWYAAESTHSGEWADEGGEDEDGFDEDPYVKKNNIPAIYLVPTN